MPKLLLIGCSAHKHRHLKRGPARQIYTGTLFRYAMRYAEQEGLRPLILSARYGFLSPDREIDTYDEKFRKPYDMAWPPGTGFFVGGSLYFSNAPARFRPLLEASKLSEWVRGLRSLCNDKSPVALGERPMKVGGVTDVIFQRLLKGPVSKATPYMELCERFGERRGMMVTIDCQLQQSRVGVERNCQLHQRGRFFWITPND